MLTVNKRNDKRFSNRGYSLFFLIGIFQNHLWLIPNKLKWQDCKIFTKLVKMGNNSLSCWLKGSEHDISNFVNVSVYWVLHIIYSSNTAANSVSNMIAWIKIQENLLRFLCIWVKRWDFWKTTQIPKMYWNYKETSKKQILWGNKKASAIHSCVCLKIY